MESPIGLEARFVFQRVVTVIFAGFQPIEKFPQVSAIQAGESKIPKLLIGMSKIGFLLKG